MWGGSVPRTEMGRGCAWRTGEERGGGRDRGSPAQTEERAEVSLEEGEGAESAGRRGRGRGSSGRTAVGGLGFLGSPEEKAWVHTED